MAATSILSSADNFIGVKMTDSLGDNLEDGIKAWFSEHLMLDDVRV